MKVEYDYYVYILTNKINTVLYVGVTNELCYRIGLHKKKVDKKSFTTRYHINKLVYYEIYNDIEEAILREKQLKAGSRKNKVKLIKDFNPEWKDLYNSICHCEESEQE